MTAMPMSKWREWGSQYPRVVIERVAINSLNIYQEQDITSGEARRIGEFFRCLADVIG